MRPRRHACRARRLRYRVRGLKAAVTSEAYIESAFAIPRLHVPKTPACCVRISPRVRSRYPGGERRADPGDAFPIPRSSPFSFPRVASGWRVSAMVLRSLRNMPFGSRDRATGCLASHGVRHSPRRPSLFEFPRRFPSAPKPLVISNRAPQPRGRSGFRERYSACSGEMGTPLRLILGVTGTASPFSQTRSHCHVAAGRRPYGHAHLEFGGFGAGAPSRADRPLCREPGLGAASRRSGNDGVPLLRASEATSADPIIYQDGNVSIRISPGERGIATIWDKDVLIYLSGLINSKIERGEEVFRTVRIAA